MARLHFRLSRQRPPAPARASMPYALGRKNIFIFPTRYGFMFISFVLIILLDALNHNNNLEFFFAFLLGGIFFISIFYTYTNLLGLRLLSVKAKPVFAAESAAFEIRVRSLSRARNAVRFKFVSGDETLADLAGQRDHRVLVAVPAEKRGILNPGTLSVSTRFPLGLFRSWSKIDLNATCMVYPKPLSVAFTPAQTGDASGRNGRSAGPGVDDFKDLRTFRPGDSLQHIYWKAFSRAQGLLTKEFMGESGSAVLLDWDAVGPADTETRLSRLCHMVLAAHEHNLAYGLKLQKKTVDVSKGDTHRHECLKALALFGA